jgi:predicted negative regulator of RcsB-dependent stress response
LVRIARLCPILLILITAVNPLCAQQRPAKAETGSLPNAENGFSTSITMFATLAAINAAGYDAGMDSPLNEHYKVRSELREILAKKKIPCLSELKAFYKEHKKPTEAGDLSQYISFSLIAGDAPKFALPDGQVPPDVEPLRGFSQILADFYGQANIADLWQRAQPAYDSAISGYQEPVINALFEANGYLRNPSGYLGRRFQIFLDLLGAPNQIQVRSYRDDYFVVITPTSEPPVDEIRDAYLGFMLDPLTFKYSEVIKQKTPLQKYADAAPALDLAYKDDFSLLVSKCLVKAIEARLMHESPEKRQAYINEAMQEGFILTAAFADLLKDYEKQQDAFRLYYPDLVGAIDVRKEEKRLKTVQFAASMPQKVVAPPAKIQLDPADESLETAQGLLDQKDIENARKTFKRVFEQTSDKAKQGRAYYGLAVIDLQEKHWDEAVDLFQRTVDSNTSPAVLAWSHYYLGQLALKAGDPEKAAAQFKQTLANEAASSKAREAAEKALQSISGDIKQ